MTKVRQTRRERSRVVASRSPERSTNDAAAGVPTLAGLSNPIARRAIDIAIWSSPLVNVEAMRRAFFDAGAKCGDIVYCSTPTDWRFQIKTPDPARIPVYFSFDLTHGPWVLEFPAFADSSLSGSINDAWQTPLIEIAQPRDGAENGYLLLPADYLFDVPREYTPVWCATNNGYALLYADSVDAVKQLRFFPLESSNSPRVQRAIDVGESLFDAIPPCDDRFFDALARMIREERVDPRDLCMHGWLRAIGIEPFGDHAFSPDAEMRSALRAAASAAHEPLVEANRLVRPYWSNLAWGTPEAEIVGARTRFGFEHREWLDADARAAFFFARCAAPEVDGGIVELRAMTDGRGAAFRGEATYTLRVPPDVPATSGWSLTVYDVETAAFNRDVRVVSLSSRDGAIAHDDGSVTVVVGPNASATSETNIIESVPGRRWFASFRFYGAQQPIRDRTWVLPNFEIVHRKRTGAFPGPKRNSAARL